MPLCAVTFDLVGSFCTQFITLSDRSLSDGCADAATARRVSEELHRVREDG